MGLTNGFRKYLETAKAGLKKTKAEAAKAPVRAAGAKPAKGKAEAKAESKDSKKKAVPPRKAAVEAKAAEPKTAARAAKGSEKKAPVQVAKAMEEAIDADTAAKREEQIQKEIADEIARDSRRTSSLVRDDCTPANASREQLILEYAPLIKYIAQKIAARLPANIELDDLISSGVIGLMDAIDKYDSSRDNKFKTYAEFRIRGAILDELRAQDWVPRSVREKAKQLERCYAKIEQKEGRQATEEEVCEELGVSQDEFHDMLNQVRSVSLLSYDDFANFSKADKRSLHGIDNGGAGRSPTPFSEVSVAYLKKMIADAIADLPEKQRLVLSLYYYEDLNLKEIGKVLDVTESRVSQLHTQAILRLKGRLRNHWDDFVALMA